jgi:hypothetical protein
MNKSRDQFSSLSSDDQKHILDLCASQTYDDIVEQLRKPRAEGGLAIATSRAALCRFFTTSHQESTFAVLAQCAAAANIQHEQHSNAFLGAIRANVEARVLESLRQGRALADMEKEFRFLKTIENIYLADARWRAGSPKGSRAAYHRYVDRCAQAPDFDFIPVEDLKNDPQGSNWMDAASDFDLDVCEAQERLAREVEARAQTFASLQAAVLSQPSKSPVIPHIPLNSTIAHPDIPQPPSTPETHQSATPARAVIPEKKAVPHVAPPKVGRNDPCPCGSGRKSKKCCTL